MLLLRANEIQTLLMIGRKKAASKQSKKTKINREKNSNQVGRLQLFPDQFEKHVSTSSLIF
jgi:hypothetical protein